MRSKIPRPLCGGELQSLLTTETIFINDKFEIMNTSVGIILVFGAVGLFVVIALYRFISQRRQLSSGRNIGRFFPKKRDGKYVFDNPITVLTGGKWHRLLLTIKSVNAHRIDYSPKYFFEKVALLAGTPYTLTLKDGKNKVIYTETGSLESFVNWLWSRQNEIETMLSDTFHGEHWGTFTILEFLPEKAGQYLISLEITAKDKFGHPGSSSTWEVLEAELSAMEDVTPLSKTVSYPHKRIRV